MSKTKTRKLHRSITLITVIPLFIIVLSGSLYSFFQYFGLDYFWLMKVHIGNFFLINLLSIFSPVMGFLTIFAILSGLCLFPRSKIKYQD